MASAKKGLLALIGTPKGEDSEEPESSSMGGETKMRAAKDALAAFKSGDAEALSDALERHYKACQGADTEDAPY